MLLGITILIVILGLVGYRYIKNKQADDVLTIGISPPYAELLQSVANEVEKQGVHVKLVEFSDWRAPNVAVQNGDIDANFSSKAYFYVMLLKKRVMTYMHLVWVQEVMWVYIQKI